MSWILAAFGFQVAGLVGATIMLMWSHDWVWPFPVAGFIGYVLAFRRGMVLWNPDIERTWRQYFPPYRDQAPAKSASKPRVTHPEPPRPPQHELRIVR